MAQATVDDHNHYYIPHSSPWPIYGSVTLFTLMCGAIVTLNGWLPAWFLLPGFHAGAAVHLLVSHRHR